MEFPSLSESAKRHLAERGIDPERSYEEMQIQLKNPSADSNDLIGRILNDIAFNSCNELTGIQLETLELIAEGLTDEEIAEQREVSIETIKTTIKDRILPNLNAKNRTHAVHRGWQLGLLR